MDKNKIIEAAAKFVAKGAYDRAIKEYQKILDVDPRDVRILQKMGELYQKKGDNSQAASYFTQVAESYTNDGFFLKAVALFKQVLRLDPSLLDINLKLAELHQQLQLLGEAMSYYQIVANHYDKAGATRRSLEVLKKMVDLDPDNVASRVKLADLYVREGMNAEASAEFQRAADYLKRNSRIDDYLRVAERLAALEPGNLALAKELAGLYLERNDQKRALAKLQVCFKADNRDIETLRLLAVAFQGLGQTSKTVSVYKEMARAFEERGQTADAEEVWAQVGALDPSDAEFVARGPAAVAPPLEVEPPPIEDEPSTVVEANALKAPPRRATVPPSSASSTSAPRPKGDSISKLLTETDVYVKYGLHDKALEHLRRVFAVEPENIDAHEKAYAIYVASNNQGQAFEQLLNVLRLHTRSGDVARAQPYLAAILQQAPAHSEVPVFLSALQADEAGEGDGMLERVSDDAILVDAADEDIIVAEEADDGLDAPPQDFELGPGGDAPAHDVALELAASPLPMAEEELHDEPLWSAPPTEGEEARAEFLGDDQRDTGAMVALPVDAVAPQEFQEAEYALGDDAPPTGLMGAAQHEDGGIGDAAYAPPTRLTPLLDPVALSASPEVTQPELLEPRAEPEPLALAAPPDASAEPEAASEEVDEAAFFIDQGLFEEAREILETVLIAYPDHVRAAQLLATLDAGAQGTAATAPVSGAAPETHEGHAPDGHDAFDLAAELASELGELGTLDGPAEAAPANEYQVSVEEVFAEFKKGLEKVVKPEDVDTHYDLGVAYKEMGLIDDAVAEFTIARKGCVGRRKELDCLSMLGLLQQLRGDWDQAIDAFVQALGTEFSTGDAEKALRYDLAATYEGQGQLGKALGQYLKVQRLDPAFRDVAAHVSDLQTHVTPEEDDAPAVRATAPKSGARKVGYI